MCFFHVFAQTTHVGAAPHGFACVGIPNHITGTADPKVVKFCTRVGYINSNNRMAYQQQRGVVMVT